MSIQHTAIANAPGDHSTFGPIFHAAAFPPHDFDTWISRLAAYSGSPQEVVEIPGNAAPRNSVRHSLLEAMVSLEGMLLMGTPGGGV